MIPEGHLLIVIDLVYTAPTDRIEPHRAAHMAFIKQCLDEGFILLSGPKVPRTGGTIIAMLLITLLLQWLLRRAPT